MVPRSFMNDVRLQLTKLINSDPTTADQNPSTKNPDITPDTIKSMTAFITKVKSPRLKIFMGRVRISKTGLKNAFSMLKIAAAKNAEIKPLTCMPSSKYELMIIENVKISHLIKMPFIIFLPLSVVPHPFYADDMLP